MAVEARLRRLVQQGILKESGGQMRAAGLLSRLVKVLDVPGDEDHHHRHQNRQSHPANHRESASKATGGLTLERSLPASHLTPRGVFLHGPVGTGKTMLMDFFYDSVKAPKRRVHFHDFMQTVHKKMHEVTQAKRKEMEQQREIDEEEQRRKEKKEGEEGKEGEEKQLLTSRSEKGVDEVLSSPAGTSDEKAPSARNTNEKIERWDPIKWVGVAMSKEVKLLCFDEFQVSHPSTPWLTSYCCARRWTSPNQLFFSGAFTQHTFAMMLHSLRP